MASPTSAGSGSTADTGPAEPAREKVFVLSGLDADQAALSDECGSPMDVEACTPITQDFSDGKDFASSDDDCYSLELDLQRNISPSFIGFSESYPQTAQNTAATATAPLSPRTAREKAASASTVDCSSCQKLFFDSRYRNTSAYGSYRGYDAYNADSAVETANAMIKRVRAASELLSNADNSTSGNTTATTAKSRGSSPSANNTLSPRANRVTSFDSATSSSSSPRLKAQKRAASPVSDINTTGRTKSKRPRNPSNPRRSWSESFENDVTAYYDTYHRGSNTQRFSTAAAEVGGGMRRGSSDSIPSTDLYSAEMRKTRTNLVDLNVDEANIVYVPAPSSAIASTSSLPALGAVQPEGFGAGAVGKKHEKRTDSAEGRNLYEFVTQNALPRIGSDVEKKREEIVSHALEAEGIELDVDFFDNNEEIVAKESAEQQKYSYSIKHKYAVYKDSWDVTMALPEVVLAHLLAFVSPWDDGLYLVNKRWCRTMMEYVPHLRLQPPCLPCTVHLELDVRSSRRVVSRYIYTLNQMLWGLPMSVQRWEWRPGQYCRAKQDWTVDDSWRIWKYIRKCLRKCKKLSEDNPHYCEMKMHEDVLMKGYLSSEDSNKFIKVMLGESAAGGGAASAR